MDKINHQGQEAGGNTPSHREGESFNCCLYFLVSTATTGSLAGLHKVGVADCFPARYRQHVVNWGAFDLARSAVLWMSSRREAFHLESALRHAFGNPEAESAAMQASGGPLTSEDYAALGSWRRCPGARADGHTEFYASSRLDPMLAFTEHWLGCREGRAASARLQRGISASDCSKSGREDDTGSLPPQLYREERRELRARQDAAQKESWQRLMAQYSVIMERVLALALAYEEHLTWVDLDYWHRSRVEGGVGSHVYGLVSLYFHRFVSVPDGQEVLPSDSWVATQKRLQESFAPIAALAGEIPPEDWERMHGSGYAACTLRERHQDSPCTLPHPICADKMLVRLESCWSDPLHPLFDSFDALARRVEERQRRV